MQPRVMVTINEKQQKNVSHIKWFVLLLIITLTIMGLAGFISPGIAIATTLPVGEELSIVQTMSIASSYDTSYGQGSALGNDGNIYMFGVCYRDYYYGSYYTPHDAILKYDPVKGIDSKINYGYGEYWYTYRAPAVTAPDGTIYVFGGSHNQSIDTARKSIYSFTPDEFKKLSVDLPSERMYAAATLGMNGKIYVFGGRNTANPIDDILEFDPDQNTIRKMAIKLPSARYGMGCAVVGDKIYLFGGSEGTNYLTDILVFDPVWKTLEVSPIKLDKGMFPYNAVAPFVDNKIYIFGGERKSGYERAIRCFDPSSNTLSTLPEEIPVSGGILASVVVDNNHRIHLLGGIQGSSTSTTNNDGIFQFARTLYATEYSPNDKASGVAVDTPITMDFTDKIKQSSLNDENLWLQTSTQKVPVHYELQNDGYRVVLKPDVPLVANTTYTVSVVNAESISSHLLENAIRYSFTTGSQGGISVNNITINPSGLSLEPTNSGNLSVVATMSDGTTVAIDNSKVNWKSNNEQIAKVDKGTVTAAVVGEAKITATYMEKTAEITVTVSTQPITTKGDVNSDGKITIMDAVKIARSLIGQETLTEAQKEAADFNDDGKVTIMDAQKIALYLVGK